MDYIYNQMPGGICVAIPLQSVVEVIDNILEPNNEAGWQAFAEVRC